MSMDLCQPAPSQYAHNTLMSMTADTRKTTSVKQQRDFCVQVHLMPIN